MEVRSGMIAIIVLTLVFHSLPIPALRSADVETLATIARSISVEGDGDSVGSRDARSVRGGSVRYDDVRNVASIEMPPSRALGTLAPYDRTAPEVAATAVFTPQPTVAPRPVPSGVPRPRRTPVSVIPSYPAPART